MKARHVKECARCHQHRTIHARGLCTSCYRSTAAAGDLDTYSPSIWARRDQVADLANEGLSTPAIAKRLGITRNAAQLAVRRARQAGRITTADTSGPQWPANPSPCKGVDTDLFLLDGNTGGGLSRFEVAQADEALTYCARCPLATRQWCVEQVSPQTTKFSGIAGGVVWLSGRARSIPTQVGVAS